MTLVVASLFHLQLKVVKVLIALPLIAVLDLLCLQIHAYIFTIGSLCLILLAQTVYYLKNMFCYEIIFFENQAVVPKRIGVLPAYAEDAL